MFRALATGVLQPGSRAAIQKAIFCNKIQMSYKNTLWRMEQYGTAAGCSAPIKPDLAALKCPPKSSGIYIDVDQVSCLNGHSSPPSAGAPPTPPPRADPTPYPLRPACSSPHPVRSTTGRTGRPLPSVCVCRLRVPSGAGRARAARARDLCMLARSTCV